MIHELLASPDPKNFALGVELLKHIEDERFQEELEALFYYLEKEMINKINEQSFKTETGVLFGVLFGCWEFDYHDSYARINKTMNTREYGFMYSIIFKKHYYEDKVNFSHEYTDEIEMRLLTTHISYYHLCGSQECRETIQHYLEDIAKFLTTP